MATPRTLFLCAATAALTLAVANGPALAAGEHSGGHGHSTDIGQPAEAGSADRTVEVEMTDMAYDPKHVTVEAGETVRFIVENAGSFVHEFALGTAAMHADHRKEMMEMMQSGVLTATRIKRDMMASGGHGMAHDDPNSVLLEPGETAEIVWTFPAARDLEFACNVPGHYESGMVGEVRYKGADGS